MLTPGIFRATVRGVPDQIVMLTDSGAEDPWVSLVAQRSGPSSRWFTHEDITDARPLVVLDFDSDVFAEVVGDLRYASTQCGTNSARRAFVDEIADQIAEQTKPARIEEPGLWGVVEAAIEDGQSRVWLHDRNSWLSFGGGWAQWDDLIDPTLVRPGIESDSGLS